MCGTWAITCPIVVKDACIRARAKRVAKNLTLRLRRNERGCYAAYFNGGRSFSIGKWIDNATKWVDLARGDSPQTCDDFFNFEFSAIGDALTLSVNGKPVMQAHDSTYGVGDVCIGELGSGLYTDVALFIPSEASLVADNRTLFGPFADPPALEDLCDRLLRKTPDNLALYKLRAELRAHYSQKWSGAAEDLARVIESIRMTFLPGTIGPCCC